MTSSTVVKGVELASRVIPVHKKYTLQSNGIWERIRRLLAISPARSNGVPLNPQYRNPPPGSNDPFSFTDPVTIPAADIADNPYWKRDTRRSYPRLSFVSQQNMVGLLKLGNRASPKSELIGEVGSQALVEAQKESELGLAAYFKKEGNSATLAVLGKDGLPPLPSGASLKAGAGKYQLTEENSYPDSYPCRTFQ